MGKMEHKKQIIEWLKYPPRAVKENMEYRLEILQMAERDTELQKLLIAKCSKNIEFYADTFCFTFDPREVSPHKPFILWTEQRKFLNWLEILYQRSQRGEKINIVVDKPRGIGITYILMLWFDWHYKFHQFSGRVGSRKEDYVDKKGDPDTLFFKLDYFYERQPKWLKGKRNRAYMSLRPKNERGASNSIIGESANPNFGRGGRKNAILFDEFGFWDWATSSWESAGESTNFRIAVSTPPESGQDSQMHKLLTNKAGKVYKYEFDWRADPRRDDEWYKQAKETKSEEEFAREVLKSYEGTTKGKVYAITVRRALLDNVDYNPSLPLFVSWDFGLDSVAMIWWQKDFSKNYVYMIDCYSNSNKEIDFFVPYISGIIQSTNNTGDKFQYTYNELEKIELHKLWKQTITHFGDPDVRKRNLINKDSVKAYLYRKHNIYIQSKPWGGRKWTDMKELTNNLFRRLIINENRCEPVLSALRNAKYPERREGSQAQNEALKPIHDWTSHFRTAVEYFADNEPFINDIKTVIGGTSINSQKTLLPHEIEEKRQKIEEDKVAGIVRHEVKTVITNNTNKYRII